MNGDLVRYARPIKKEIVYNILPTSSGWQIQVFLPNRLSPTDRMMVLDWIHAYRAQVRAENPTWVTFFHFGEQAYFLNIIRADTQQEMIAAVIDVAETWRQMDFEYA